MKKIQIVKNKKNIDDNNTLHLIISEFKKSGIKDLVGIKNTKISVFPLFAKNGNTLFLNFPEKKHNTFDARAFGETIIKTAKQYIDKTIENIVISTDEKTISEVFLNAIIDGIYLGEYSFEQFKGIKTKEESEDNNENFEVSILNNNCDEALEKYRNAWTTGVKFTKDMINMPPSIAIPSFIDKETRKLFKEEGVKNIKITSILEKELESLGAGGILSVGQASPDESRFLVVEYIGQKKPKNQLV
jgi:leucyl aminopeptidase